MEYIPIEGQCCYDCAACTLIKGDKLPCGVRRIVVTLGMMLADNAELKEAVSAIKVTAPDSAEVGVEPEVKETDPII